MQQQETEHYEFGKLMQIKLVVFQKLSKIIYALLKACLVTLI